VLLGLDLGAAGAHAVAIDETGALVASAFSEYGTHSPRLGWFEQDPADWRRAALQVLAGVAAAVQGEIRGLGLTGQPGCVFVDGRGEPVRPAILGGDRRAVLQAERINDQIGRQRLIEISGGPALPGHHAPVIRWLRDVEPVQFRHTRQILLPKDHVRLMLTGEAATDATDAAGTRVQDLRGRSWSDELLGALEIPVEWMPPVHESTQVAGGLRPSLALSLGLPSGLPVAAGASEAAAAAISLGLLTPGLVGSTIDRAGLLYARIDGIVTDSGGIIQTACAPAPLRYDLLGTTPSAGGSLRWWRDVLGWRLGYEALCAPAESVAAGADGLIFEPDTNGQGGAFVGLRAHHVQADLTRAVMEGVVLSLRARLDVMRTLGVDMHQLRATGGGSRSRLWRQIQADVFAVPVAAMTSTTSPALGAALLAGVATGVFGDVRAAAERVVRLDNVIEPDPERIARYDQVYRTFTTLDSAIRQPAIR
jgi:xylulokinase